MHWINAVSTDATGIAMFKNLSVYEFNPDWAIALQAALQCASKSSFLECGPTQPVSAGFSPPRHLAHSPLIETYQGHWFLEVTVQKRDLPGRVVKDHLEARLDEIFKQTGRRPTGKAKRELKEEVTMSLLPKAFLKTETIAVWIDPSSRILCIDATSKAKTDLVTSLLCATFQNFYVKPLSTAQSMSACVSAWLKDGEPPTPFTLDDECELKDPNEDGGLIRYAHHSLDIEQIKAHLDEGKSPVKVAMTWSAHVSFVLTEALQLRKVGFLDVVLKDPAYAEGENFDVTVAIVTAELSKLLPDLVEALGGKQPDLFDEPGEAPASSDESAPEESAEAIA